MAKINTKMNYDEEEDILSLSRGRKVKSSMDIGDFIIDIDYSGFIVGIEILNATKNLNLSQLQLKALEEAAMSITYKPNNVCITIIMKIKDKEKDITIPLSIDLGHGSVKTESIQFAVA